MKRSWAFYVVAGGAVLWVLFRGAITDRIGVYEHTGTVASTDRYEVEEHVSMIENERVVLYEVVFEDGSWATGTDAGLYELRAGETVTLECLRDRQRIPVIDPGWYRCTDAMLLRR